MDRSQLPSRLKEWQDRLITCRLLDGKQEMGHLKEIGDDWMVLLRPNGREIILFNHALVSIEERARTNE
jgi:sRNA-binding regulator protein Hfq